MKLIIGLVLIATICSVATLAANAPVAFHTATTFTTTSLTQSALVASSGVSDPNFAPYAAFDPFEYNAFNFTSTRCTVPSTSVLNAFKISLQKVLLSFSASEKADNFIISSLLGGNGQQATLRKYAEDYGHIVHNTPMVVVVPSTTALVAKLVKAVKSVPCNSQFAPVKIVIRGAGGNVEGGSQIVDVATLISKQELDDDNTIPPLQILLDLGSRLNSVATQATTVGSQKSLWASAGATWLAFTRAAATLGLRPYVAPDYFGITLGGSLSIGGVGGDSAFRGLCAHHVAELEVVNSDGDVLTVTPTSNLFKSVLGGMGQFGIMTRVRINLEPNHPFTRIYHYVSTDINVLLRAVDKIQQVNQGSVHVNTVQTFIVPGTLDFIINWVLNGRTTYRSPEEEAQVNALVSQGLTYIYLLEMTKRFDSTAESLEQIAALCDETFDLAVVDDMPTNIWDERLYYFSLPALIQTGAWTQRHPWLNIYLAGDVFVRDETGKSDFDRLIDRFTPLKSTGFGHIGLYPILTSPLFTSASLPFLSVPTTSKWSYLMVVGRDDAFGTDAGLNYQAFDNRKIWDDMTRSVFQFDRPRATLYASNYIPDFGNSDWKKYFGKCSYNQFVASKRTLDPNNIFMDNRNFF